MDLLSCGNLLGYVGADRSCSPPGASVPAVFDSATIYVSDFRPIAPANNRYGVDASGGDLLLGRNLAAAILSRLWLSFRVHNCCIWRRLICLCVCTPPLPFPRLVSSRLRFDIQVDFEQATGTNGILFTLDLDSEDSCVGNLQLRSANGGLSLVWYRFGVTVELQVGGQPFNDGVRFCCCFFGLFLATLPARFLFSLP